MVFTGTFNHGVRTIPQTINSRPVDSNNEAVIGIIGTSPQALVAPENRSLNDPIQILSPAQGVEFFGPDAENYTIPRALTRMFAHVSNFGGVKFLVINVLDDSGPPICTPNPQYETAFIVTELVIDLSGPVCQGLIARASSSGSGFFTLSEGVDYTVDYSVGTFTILETSTEVGLGDFLEIEYSNLTGGGNISFVNAEPHKFSSGDVIQLPVGLQDLILTDVGAGTTYVEDTDYTVNLNTGLVARISSGSIPVLGDVEATYNFVDPLTVTDAQIIGEEDVDNNRTGLKAFIDSFNKYGYLPKILVAPWFSDSNAVTGAMDETAFDLDCMTAVDAPEGTNYNDVITGRGPTGTINFNYSSDRLVLCYPHLRTFRPLLNDFENEPASISFAARWADLIIRNGYWWSPSNKLLRDVQGLERKISFIPGRSDNEATGLNAVGICTTVNFYGAGFLTWGNRSSAFPNSTDPRNFIGVKFSEIILLEALRRRGQQFIDNPLTNFSIDSLLDDLNAFVRSQIVRGALLQGSQVLWDVNDNPPSSTGQGQAVLRFEWLSPIPAEDIVILSFVNIELNSALNQGRELVGVS